MTLTWALGVILFGVTVGCRRQVSFHTPASNEVFQVPATEIEYPDVNLPQRESLWETPQPRSARDEPPEFWDLTLKDAIQLALDNGEVLRDLGGLVVRSPNSVSTVYDPAIRETEPRIGPEAALSEFDAQFSASMSWGLRDRVINNELLAGGRRSFQADVAEFDAEISKVAATGTAFSLRHLTEYDKSNSPRNLFSSAYDMMLEAELRQPLLQGAGLRFNRIAGPNARPGSYNGVVIARIQTDMTLADFEASVIDWLFDIEQTYWQLYYSYRDLDAKLAGRDAALEIWRLVQRKLEVGSADPEQEALAREQYYLMDKLVVNALSGTGTSAQGGAGVQTVERRLRSLLGWPSTGQKMIRPADEPSNAEVRYDWRQAVSEALSRRVELRKQKWVIKRRELELVAAGDFRKMRLDFAGQYRWRGLGDDLFGNRHVPLGSASRELLSGKFQEWNFGLELDTPIGNRIGHLAARNAELMLSRERALYKEQELRVVEDLSNAFAELERAYLAIRADYNRATAARKQRYEVRRKFEGGVTALEFALDSNIRTTQAEGAYYRSLIDVNLATARLHRARGALLEYYQVYLNEAPWSTSSKQSAAERSRYFAPRLLDYVFTVPRPISTGGYPQMTERIDWESPSTIPEPPGRGPQPTPIQPPPVIPDMPHARAFGE